ncbi:MAG TPA: PaaI family thioesterase [Candidatus Eisenbacteria bacterium]|nr:PaaI family thioesterase [Candidatus Eisenbacteria bacterium]
MPVVLEDDHMCFACGRLNAAGLRLRFDHEPGILRSRVIFKKEHQGFKDVVHGGMMALVLDEMMVNLAWMEGHGAVTAELTVRLKKAARVGEEILLEGRIEGVRGKLLRAGADARTSTGELLATASASCIRTQAPAVRLG